MPNHSHFTDYSEPKATLEQPARFGWPRNTTVTHGIPEVDDQTTYGDKRPFPAYF